ncbi:MAG: polysaccharide deacetylase family protein [Thermomicrobiales bacterium]
MYLSFLLDVEDFVSPGADDIAKAVADLLTAERAPVTLCVVGERARQWRARQRTDVIAAIGRHDVGFHTDLHSIHPTIAEYLAPRGWDDGVAEAVRREEPGVRAIREVFGVMPSCWAIPGRSWGPQIHEAMQQLGVPAVIYSPTRVPHGDIHRFRGILTYPLGRSLRDALYHDTPAWERRLAELKAELDTDRRAGIQWAQVFLGHPSRILHEEYWDLPSFGNGRNPPPAEWILPRRKSDADLDTALANLRRTVRELAVLPGCEPRTIREMNACFANAVEEPLTEDEQALIAPEIDRAVAGIAGWPILPRSFDTAPLRAMTSARMPTLRRLRLAATSASGTAC